MSRQGFESFAGVHVQMPVFSDQGNANFRDL